MGPRKREPEGIMLKENAGQRSCHLDMVPTSSCV